MDRFCLAIARAKLDKPSKLFSRRPFIQTCLAKFLQSEKIGKFLRLGVALTNKIGVIVTIADPFTLYVKQGTNKLVFKIIQDF